MVAAPVPALQRAKRILDLMARHPQRRFRAAEVARELDIHRASCFSLLTAMAELGLVHRHEAGPTYSLGPALLQLGAKAGASHDGFQEARVEMHRLARELKVGCLVSARVDFEIVILDSVGVDETFFPGRRSPLRAPAGTVYLAWSPLPEIEAWLTRSGLSESDEDRRALVRAAAAIRARGYSVGGDAEFGLSLEQMLRQLSDERSGQGRDEALLQLATLVRRSGTAIAPGSVKGFHYIIAPIFNRNHEVVLTLTLLSGPTPFPVEKVEDLASEVVEAADRVSSVLRVGTR